MFLTSMTWLNFRANELKAECILERGLSDFEHGRCHQKQVWAKISFGGVWPVCNPTGPLVLVRVTLILGNNLSVLNFDPLMQEWPALLFLPKYHTHHHRLLAYQSLYSQQN